MSIEGCRYITRLIYFTYILLICKSAEGLDKPYSNLDKPFHSSSSKDVPDSIVNTTTAPTSTNTPLFTSTTTSSVERVSTAVESACARHSARCEQLCIEETYRYGFHCACNRGYRVKNVTSCEDVDECKYVSCSHKCINTVGSYRCECNPGYILNATNPNKCEVANGTIYMLITTTNGGILKYDTKTRSIEVIIPKYFEVYHGMDYMYDINMVFWMDYNRKVIRQASIIKNNYQITSLVSIDTKALRALAADWIHHNLYWTDTTKDSIEVINVLSKIRKTIFIDKSSFPHEIAIDPLEGWMFWSTRGLNHTLQRAGLDGSERRVIVNEDVKDVYYIVVDLETKRLFWTDPYNDKLFYSSDYDGKDIKKFFSHDQFFRLTSSIDVFEDYVYVSKLFSPYLYTFSKTSGRRLSNVKIESYNLMSVHVFHPLKQPKGVNYCEEFGNNCSHLCLAAPNLNTTSVRFSCACPDKMTLSSDSHTCIEDTPTLSSFRSITTEAIDIEISNDTSVTCPPDKPYRCKTGAPQCIHTAWVCDDDEDCGDGSDEADCPMVRCLGDRFLCDNGRCLTFKHWVCDGEDDCGDNSDEKSCRINKCSVLKYTCDNGECYLFNKKCDGHFDCSDRSDEKDCPSRCSSLQFKCADGKGCISKDYICDADKDCTDGSDEINCPKRCLLSEFKCQNDNCISKIKVCDRVDDCGDNSDEKDCSTSSSLHCDPKTKFDCGLGECISNVMVCDGKHDCNNGQDESERCDVNECARDNGGCSQICVDQKIGFNCVCNKGYKLQEDNTTCVDVDECATYGACSQNCTNTMGSFVCECRSGYKLNATDNHSCQVEWGHPSLVFANGKDVRKFDLKLNIFGYLASNLKNAVGLDYIYENKTILWTDVEENLIKSCPMEGVKTVEILVSEKLVTPDGLAIDWIHNNLYWTDQGRDNLDVMSMTNKARKTLFNDLDEPRALVLNPIEGWMFWSDWGKNPRIEKAGLDGSYREVIISSDMGWPNGLAIDYEGRRIFWADAKLHTIKSADYNGGDIKTVLTSTYMLSHPFSLDVFEDWIYFTDWKHDSILRLNKFTGNNRTIILKYLLSPMTIRVFHPYKQPQGMNLCATSGRKCSHLCLPAPQIDAFSQPYYCACPDGMSLLVDEYICFLSTNETIATSAATKTLISTTSTVSSSSETTISSTVENTEAKPQFPPSSTSLTTDSSTKILPDADFSTHIHMVPSDDELIANSTLEAHEASHNSSNVVLIVIIVVLALVILIVIGAVAYRHYNRRNRSNDYLESFLYSKSADDRLIIRNKLFSAEEL